MNYCEMCVLYRKALTFFMENSFTWGKYGKDYCPVCNVPLIFSNMKEGGHAFDCWLAILLKLKRIKGIVNPNVPYKKYFIEELEKLKGGEKHDH